MSAFTALFTPLLGIFTCFSGDKKLRFHCEVKFTLLIIMGVPAYMDASKNVIQETTSTYK
jgi:hypothetical protein